MAIIGGTSGNDTRIGTKYYDTISTGNGNDLVFALQGNDTVFAGNGNDTAYGGDGRDWLYGGTGRDSLWGDTAGDRLDGGNDNDILWGGTGDDTAWGGNGADQAWGGDGRDSLRGDAGNDLLGGGNGDDLLTGGAGNDSHRGAAGTDTAVFSGTFDGYGIVRAGGLITVTDTDTTDGNDGTDRLVDVEKLQFADRTVTLRPLDLEIVTAAVGTDADILFNLGGRQGGAEGTFADTAVAIPGGTLNYPELALGDLDGDGDLDGIAVSEDQPVRILENADGAGGMSPTEVPDSTTRAYEVALGDLDNDGDLDAVVGTWISNYGGTDGDNRLLINQGGLQGGNEGDFVMDADPLAGGKLDTTDLQLGDLDGDGDLDVLVANGAEGNQILWNQGGNSLDFVAEDLPASGIAEALAIGDLDNDGDLDGLIGTACSPDQILWNQGGRQGGDEGDFDVEELAGPAVSNALALGDLDLDGDLDAVVAAGNAGVVTYVNQGGLQSGNLGDFLVSDRIDSISGDIFSVALGDLDGDGDLDVVTGLFNGEAHLLVNQGGLQGGSVGAFADGATLASGAEVYTSIVLGDLDGDGTGGLTASGLPWLGDGLAYGNETTLLG